MTNLEKVLFSGEVLDFNKLSKILTVEDTFISSCINNKVEFLALWELKNIIFVITLLSCITGDIASSMKWLASSTPVPGYGETALEMLKKGQVMFLVDYLTALITAGAYA